MTRLVGAGTAGQAGLTRSAGRRPATRRRAVGVVAAVALALVAGGCGSGHPGGVATGGSSTTLSPPSSGTGGSTPPSTASNLATTVPNCGGGAFEPKTLLIVCGSGSGTTMATGVSWKSWDHSGATGSGTVSLQVAGRATSAPATLSLSTVVAGPVGPQFTILTVTWTGSSPDGKAQDTYHLQAGS